jgi:hypothetical protein
MGQSKDQYLYIIDRSGSSYVKLPGVVFHSSKNKSVELITGSHIQESERTIQATIADGNIVLSVTQLQIIEQRKNT